MKLLIKENGQALVEYVVVSLGVLIGIFTINKYMLPALNTLYDLIAYILSLPIP